MICKAILNSVEGTGTVSVISVFWGCYFSILRSLLILAVWFCGHVLYRFSVNFLNTCIPLCVYYILITSLFDEIQITGFNLSSDVIVIKQFHVFCYLTK